MSNPCGFTAASYQDIADILCTVQTNLSSQLSTLIAQVSALNNYVVDASTGLPRAIGDIDGLRDWVGDPMGGPTVTDQLVTVASVVASISTDTGTIQSTQASQDVSLAEINADIDEANDAIGIAGGGKVDIIDAVQSTGVISLIVGLADFAKSGGGSSTFDLVQWLLSMWNAPPLAVLFPSSSAPLSTNISIGIAAGDYGYVLSFTVPAYWGRSAGTPVEYIPGVARAVFVGPYGKIGPMTSIVTDVSQVYPIPDGATSVEIHLEPGIVGTYQVLRFL